VVDDSARRIALLPVHPEFASAILAGRKTVEFRRRAPRGATHVLVYATAPISGLMGWFEIAGVDLDAPARLWARWRWAGRIDKRRFDTYYANTDVGAAIRVGPARAFDRPIALTEAGLGNAAPQSFRWVEPKTFAALVRNTRN
jgi:predicted transcriptional regulator